MGLIYADFKTNKIKSAIKRLHEFYIHYPLLVEEILSDKHIEPKSIEYELGYASPGSIEEAYDYYKRTSIVWENNPDFIEFLMNNKQSK